jgi:hypothetical protein
MGRAARGRQGQTDVAKLSDPSLSGAGRPEPKHALLRPDEIDDEAAALAKVTKQHRDWPANVDHISNGPDDERTRFQTDPCTIPAGRAGTD